MTTNRSLIGPSEKTELKTPKKPIKIPKAIAIIIPNTFFTAVPPFLNEMLIKHQFMRSNATGQDHVDSEEGEMHDYKPILSLLVKQKILFFSSHEQSSSGWEYFTSPSRTSCTLTCYRAVGSLRPSLSAGFRYQIL